MGWMRRMRCEKPHGGPKKCYEITVEEGFGVVTGQKLLVGVTARIELFLHTSPTAVTGTNASAFQYQLRVI
jgi:hypothetical protein